MRWLPSSVLFAALLTVSCLNAPAMAVAPLTTYAVTVAGAKCLSGYHRTTLYGEEQVKETIGIVREMRTQLLAYAGCARRGSPAATTAPVGPYWSTYPLARAKAACPVPYRKVAIEAVEPVTLASAGHVKLERRTLTYQGCETEVIGSPCPEPQFAETLSTNAASYAPGQAVHIILTYTYAGPSCYGPRPFECGIAFSASNSVGQQVWNSLASPTSPFLDAPGCFPPLPDTLVAGWSTSQSSSWTQAVCVPDANYTGTSPPNPDCSEAQVPEGSYTIAAGSASPVSILIG